MADAAVSAAIIGAHAAFMQSGVALDVATRDDANQPHLTVGWGCRVSLERRRVSVLVGRRQSEPFLAALAASRAIAVTFGRPRDHCSIQVKGFDAAIEPLIAGDRELMLAYRAALAADMALIGFGEEVTHGYLACDPPDATAVSFTPVLVYEQTPGPTAGEPLD
jgi:hypothetical protein